MGLASSILCSGTVLEKSARFPVSKFFAAMLRIAGFHFKKATVSPVLSP